MAEEEKGLNIPDAGPETEGQSGKVVYPSELDEQDEEEGGSATLAGPAEAEAAPVKANTLNRSIARFIDILFALMLGRLPDYIGVFAALTYIGVADGLLGGRSPGKRIIGLHVLDSRTGAPVDFRASILRNSTIGLLYLFSLVPFAGWALALLGLCFELVLIIGSPAGRRLGDEIAMTVVADDAAGR